MFLGKKRSFWGKNSKPLTVMGEGGVPPFAVIFFPLIFWPAACRDGGRGGGVPPSRQKAVIGVFEPFPNSHSQNLEMLFLIFVVPIHKSSECNFSCLSVIGVRYSSESRGKLLLIITTIVGSKDPH